MMNELQDGEYTAVVDSIEDGLASVFFERDGESLGGDVIDAAALPEAAQEADAILHVTVEDGECTEWEYDPETTEERAEAAQSRFDRLSQRPPSGSEIETDEDES
jgi:hypothetical protein